MQRGRGAADEDVTPQPASDVRAIDPVGPDALKAAQATWPTAEPDRTVWRLLACARAGGDTLSDERIQRVLTDRSLAEIAAARARVESAIPPVVAEDAPLGERLAEPSITHAEAVAAGLVDDEDDDQERACGSST
jgi:hypothetical protein